MLSSVKLILIVLFLQAPHLSTVYAKVRSCRNVYSSSQTKTGGFTFRGKTGRQRLVALRRYEEIDPEVRSRLELDLLQSIDMTIGQKQDLAIAYIRNPTPVNRDALFTALQQLIPIALRPIAHLIKDISEYENYSQVGQLALLNAIQKLQNTNLDKIQTHSYWRGTLNRLRAEVFRNLRNEYKNEYYPELDSATSSSISFQEAILLFGGSNASLKEISEKYNRTMEEAIAERDSIEATPGRWDTVVEAIPEARQRDGRDPFENAMAAQRERWIDHFISGESSSTRLIIRLRFFHGMTLEQVASSFELSRERVRKIEEKFRIKLKHRARNPLHGTALGRLVEFQEGQVPLHYSKKIMEDVRATQSRGGQRLEFETDSVAKEVRESERIYRLKIEALEAETQVRTDFLVARIQEFNLLDPLQVLAQSLESPLQNILPRLDLPIIEASKVSSDRWSRFEAIQARVNENIWNELTRRMVEFVDPYNTVTDLIAKGHVTPIELGARLSEARHKTTKELDDFMQDHFSIFLPPETTL